MIYLDTSVVLAQLFSEDRRAPIALWNEVLVSSRLLEYEVWNRVHARKLGSSHEEATRSLLARLAFLELTPDVLQRAREPFPLPVRTLDALHLASADYLRAHQQTIQLATFDDRMAKVAQKMGLPLVALPLLLTA